LFFQTVLIIPAHSPTTWFLHNGR